MNHESPRCKNPGLGCPAAIIGLLNTSLCMRWLIEEKVIRPTLEDYILNNGSPALSLCADHTQFRVILSGLGSDVVEIYDTDDICLPLLDM